MSEQQPLLTTCPTDGCSSTTSCKLIELVAQHESMLEDADILPDDLGLLRHQYLAKTCLRYADVTRILSLDDTL